MKKLKKVFCLLLVITFVPFFVSCKSGYSCYDLTAFNCPVHIETYSKTLTEDVKKEIKDTLVGLEKDFSLNSEDSFTYKLKNAPLNESVTLSDEQKAVYQTAKNLSDFSDGKFTPLIYPLSKLWGWTENGKTLSFTPPTKEEIENVQNSGKLSFDSLILSGNSLSKTADCTLDYGGVLKGYASEKIASLLRSNGFDDGYVNVGSSSISVLKVDTLTVRHPRDTSKGIISVDLKSERNVEVSTSGDYENFREYQGIRYSHIINPTTGYPQDTDVISATVITDDGAFADAITTALCLMDFDLQNKNGSTLVSFIRKIENEHQGAYVFAVYNDGNDKIIVTNKAQNTHFKLLDQSYSVYQIAD